jgi:hypothetical protein
VFEDFGHDDRAIHAGAANGYVPVVGDEENVAQLNAAARFRINARYVEQGTFLHTVLFSASADYGVYHKPP